jgi:hypothetical protein
MVAVACRVAVPPGKAGEGQAHEARRVTAGRAADGWRVTCALRDAKEGGRSAGPWPEREELPTAQ